MRYEQHNLDGQGSKRTMVFDMPVENSHDYWQNVTDVPCPTAKCEGVVRWHEAGYVPGYRICDKCKKHFLAKGNASEPKLLRVGSRVG